MSFYDNVKENVRNEDADTENTEDGSERPRTDEDGNVAFDELISNAEQADDEDEQEQHEDDTEIENFSKGGAGSGGEDYGDPSSIEITDDAPAQAVREDEDTADEAGDGGQDDRPHTGDDRSGQQSQPEPAGPGRGGRDRDHPPQDARPADDRAGTGAATDQRSGADQQTENSRQEADAQRSGAGQEAEPADEVEIHSDGSVGAPDEEPDDEPAFDRDDDREAVLRDIREQNQTMIELLRSIERSLR